jgi:3-hydroxyacyl-CoA dehydrogenase/enoyl-CoA hydratase/3-hydroxybutyryl-CoA epimerase
MYQYWKLEREIGNVAVCVFNRDDKPVNVLSEAPLRELNSILDSFATDTSLTGVVIISGKKDFILGADIEEIARFRTAEDAAHGAKSMQAILSKIENLKVPSVAAINGNCLGGGLELALACTWRIATDDASTKLALPEIQLGLIPGAGGTQRLPRLIGIQSGLDMILTGKRVPARKALKIGLIDACVPIQLLREQAVKMAVQKRKKQSGTGISLTKKWSSDLPKWATEGNALGRKLIYKKAREMIDEKTKGFYPASYKALDAIFDGFDSSLAKGLDREAELFGQLTVTRESKSLIHLYHATNSLKKHRFKEAGDKRFGKRKPSSLGVIGAGFMGAGITTVAVEKGYKILISDPNKDSVGRCMKHVSDYFGKKVSRKRLKPFEASQKLAQVSPGLNTTGFGTCDLVVEAVFEDIELKKKILKGVEKSAGEDFIFASNTSAIPISKIAEGTEHPERVIGMHFFSPVEKMPLLEIVVTDKTADWVTARTIEVGQDMGKQVIVVKDGPGFYTTRALSFFLNEASLMLMEGAPIDAIDGALAEFGFPVGPITLIDEVGIDVGMHVLETIQGAFPDRMTTPKGLIPVAESGRLGRKNNKGFYLYQDGKKGRPDNSVYQLLGITPSPGKLEKEEMTDRCVLVFVNESIRCLEEQILANAYDGDVGAVFGLGFPPFLGGPFKYVDHLGAREVVDRLRGLADKYGARFKPADLLVKMADENKRFFESEA